MRDNWVIEIPPVPARSMRASTILCLDGCGEIVGDCFDYKICGIRLLHAWTLISFIALVTSIAVITHGQEEVQKNKPRFSNQVYEMPIWVIILLSIGAGTLPCLTICGFGPSMLAAYLSGAFDRVDFV